jgi:hypothetical protein
MVTFYANAQVTIGALDEPVKGAMLDLSPKSAAKLGGLLLPNIFITDSDSLPASLLGSFSLDERDNFPDLKGMVVYNSNPDLAGGEGLFVWNGSGWKKTGAGDEFKSECENTVITDAGGNIDCASIDNSCTVDADYSFSLIAGGEFCTLTVVDAKKGKFNLALEPNSLAEARNAIVMITSPCGSSHVFVYSQAGNTADCGTTTTAPKIKSENGINTICTGGSALLYLDGRPSGIYIWTRNGAKVGEGTDFVATQSGRYIVYADKIGCTTVKPDTLNLTAGTTVAPAAVTVSALNNGYVCTVGGTAQLSASGAAGGTIRWYQDGSEQISLAGNNSIAAEVGVWYAIVEDGDCFSQKSNEINVALSPDAGIPLPDYTISGQNKVEAGDTKIYIATTDNPQENINYHWTVTPGTTGATVFGSNRSNSVQVHFQASGEASINLDVSNTCETATVTNNDMGVVVGCQPVAIYSYTPDRGQ